MTARFLSRPRRDTVEILAYLDTLRSLAVSKPDRLELIQGLQTSDLIIDDAAHMPLSPWFEVRLFDRAEVERTLALYDAKESRAARTFLATLARRPEVRMLRRPPSLAAVQALGVRFPNFRPVVDLIEAMTVLARARPGSPLQLPPILLAGAPGVGKTAFAVALAETLGLEWSMLGVAHATAGFDLGGLDSAYGGGGPGLLTRQVALSVHPDRVVVLDELDKAPPHATSDPLGPLYELLEPSTAKRFMDDGVKVRIDMSHITWIGTVNGLDKLEPALRSRFSIFHIDRPTRAQAKLIAQTLYAELLGAQAWGHQFEALLSHEVLNLLSAYGPRESKAVLVLACGRALKAGRGHLQLEDFDLPAPTRRGMGFL